MEPTATIKAGELSLPARQRLTGILHVQLSDADELVVALRRSTESSAPDKRVAARQRLVNLLHRLDENQSQAIPNEEIEAAIDEAMQFVRRRV